MYQGRLLTERFSRDDSSSLTAASDWPQTQSTSSSWSRVSSDPPPLELPKLSQLVSKEVQQKRTVFCTRTAMTRTSVRTPLTEACPVISVPQTTERPEYCLYLLWPRTGFVPSLFLFLFLVYSLTKVTLQSSLINRILQSSLTKMSLQSSLTKVTLQSSLTKMILQSSLTKMTLQNSLSEMILQSSENTE